MSDEETIFTEALSRGSAEERSAFLKQACGGDAALRARVDVLLDENVDIQVKVGDRVAGGSSILGVLRAGQSRAEVGR